MKILNIKLIAFFAVLGLVAACSLDSNDQTCNTYAFMSTQSVTGPDTAVINETITLNITFVIGNNCGTFNSFKETNGYPKDIVARVDYIGCNCDNVQTTGTESYEFTATQAGEYVLRFLTDDTNAPITKTITVTEE